MSLEHSSPKREPRTAAGTLLRVLFAAIFATTGFLLGRDAYTHALSLHVASQIWQITLLVVAPIVGALIGVFVAPFAQSLFENELATVERAIERLSPSELVGGAVGLIVGLVIAFLIKSVLFEFITFAGRAGSYVAIVLYI